ncbi:MAG: hypothetical protein ACFFEF_06070 [Candidatus Thorarchaeota archaeon]
MSPVERKKKRERLIFASIMRPEQGGVNDLLLAESIRAYAGSLSHAPIWYFVPETGRQLLPSLKNRLQQLGVTTIPFQINGDVLEFPFVGQVFAQALAEITASGQTDIIAWLNTNTVVLKEPKEFILHGNKNLGYRPVHHALIGSRYDEPLDSFWSLIYELCEVPEGNVFPMTGHIDGVRIRPYFNAGIIITRPEKRLFRTYRDVFLKIYQKPIIKDFYQRNELYAVFIHQAVLAGVILSSMQIEELQELSGTYNYPLHLLEEDVTEHRPQSLEEMVTFRHEGFHRDPDWFKRMPADITLRNWIAGVIQSIS